MKPLLRKAWSYVLKWTERYRENCVLFIDRPRRTFLGGVVTLPMSALGQKRTCAMQRGMSAKCQ